ncbi:MAG: DUF899 family protein [bacterium]|jgi:predicted dithiol-disulfide oxidoreductase (DUF899 family)
MKPETRVKKLNEKMEKLHAEIAEAYKQLSGTPVQDYALTDRNGKKVRLSKLFGKHDKLALVHNMGRQCPYCTMWADGFNSLYHYVERRAAFVVVSPDPPEIQKAFAEKRGWKFKMLSAHGTTLFKDLGFEFEGKPWPGLSTLYKGKDGGIMRHAFKYFGPGDGFCSVWSFYEMLPE